MWPILTLVIYCVCLILASLLGGWLPSIIRLTHTRMQLMMSFVGGLMMGVALLHLLPHSVVESGSLNYASWSCTVGLLAMFLLIRVFHVHQHSPEPKSPTADEQSHDEHLAHCQATQCPPAECQSAGCQHSPADHEPCVRTHRLNWLGLFMGMAIHSLIDGVAVAASVVACSEHSSSIRLLGIGTFIAVLFHKPLDSLSIASVMVSGNWSERSRKLVNGIFSLICPAGALLFFFGTRELANQQQIAVGCALGFSAGVFLCISLADILPEIQFHRHDRVKLFATLLLGVGLAFAIGLFEPEHAHDLEEPTHVHQHAQ